MGWPPAAQLMPTRIRVTPITAMMVPVTTGGKSGSMRLISGATRMPKIPAAITAPKIAVIPRSGLPAIASIGLTAAKVTPIITGRRMPKGPTPKAWIRVTMPQHSRSALISRAIWSLGSLRAPPRISGTATAPAYITSTCCRPSAKRRGSGSFWSTGWTSAGLVTGFS